MAGAAGRPIADEPTAGPLNRRGTVPETPYTDQPLEASPDDDLDPGLGGNAGDDEDYVYLPPESSLTRRILWVVGGVVLFFGLLFAVGGWWVMNQVNPSDTGEAITVTVPPGSTTAQIANLLEREGVITNATVFQYYVKWQDAGPFEAGIYDQMHKRSSMGDVVDRLEAGPLPPNYTELVIPEGMWLKDISAKILQTFPQMNELELNVALNTVRSKYQPEDSTNLEGLLFPATYRVEEGDELDEQKLIRQMTEKFDATADEIGLSDTSAASAATGRELSPYEVVIVASMIEKEAKVPEERAMIAQVIYNRLNQGMTLGIDATVLYAIGEQKEQLTQSDLRVDSPYNTRRYEGLPPTPIASPGRASLEAALHPADGPWVYYVIEDERGHHFFTDSSSEFEKARQRAQQAGLL
jgi:peptidoglycan lytic transglycosylase G